MGTLLDKLLANSYTITYEFAPLVKSLGTHLIDFIKEAIKKEFNLWSH